MVLVYFKSIHDQEPLIVVTHAITGSKTLIRLNGAGDHWGERKKCFIESSRSKIKAAGGFNI